MHLGVRGRKKGAVTRMWWHSIFSCVRCMILGFALSISGNLARASEAVTIFVDGITPWKAWSLIVPPEFYDLFVGASNDRPTSRLRDSPLAKAIAKELGGTQEYVLWSGSPSDTINLDRAVSETLNKILVADRAGKEVHMVTHSMGTVIGYLALARYRDLISRTSSADRYRGVANFVTLASPLGSSVLMRFLIEANRDLGIDKAVADHQTADSLMIRGSWLNVHAQNDPIAATLSWPWISNQYLPFAGSPIAAHSLPHGDPGSVAQIVKALDQPSLPAKTDTIATAPIRETANDGQAEIWVYWLEREGRRIRRARPDGSGASDIVTSIEYPSGFALDARAGCIYWGEGRQGKYWVRRANLNGSGASTLYEGRGRLVAITVSQKSGRIFWTENDGNTIPTKGSIKGMNSDGTGLAVLLEPADGVGSIVVSDALGIIYWVEHRMGVGRIHQIGIDGTNHKVFRDIGGLQTVLGVDDLQGKLYWLRLDAPKMTRANFDGSEMESLQVPLKGSAAFTIDSLDRTLYFDADGGYYKRLLRHIRVPGSPAQHNDMVVDFATVYGGGGAVQLSVYHPRSKETEWKHLTLEKDQSLNETQNAAFKMELDRCTSFGYRHVSVHVPPSVDLSDEATTVRVLQDATEHARHYCRDEKDSFSNIDVDIFQEGWNGRVVHARNYDDKRQTWLEFQNDALDRKRRIEQERLVAERKLADLEDRRRSEERIALAASRKPDVTNVKGLPSDLLRLLGIEVAKIKDLPACRKGCGYPMGQETAPCITGCKDFEVFCNTSMVDFSRADRANGISDGRYVGVSWVRYGPPGIPGGLILEGERPQWNEHRAVFKFLRAHGEWRKEEIGIWSPETCPR